MKEISIWLGSFEDMDEAINEAETKIKKWGYDLVRIMSKNGAKCVKIVRK